MAGGDYEQMKAVLLLLITLILISVMFATALMVVWHGSGRPRHAATWAAAYLTAAVQWGVSFLFVAFYPGSLLSFALVNGLAMVSLALLAVGFRQRAGRSPRAGLLIGGALVGVAIVVVTTFILPHAGIRQATSLFFVALMVGLMAPLVVRGGGPANIAERALVVMLVIFAVFVMGAAGVALKQGQAGDQYYLMLFRLIVLMFVPAGFAGVGLFVVLLLAADYNAEMRRLAASDPLTGVLNRRGFEEAAVRAIANARRHRQPLSVVAADLDRFKLINDRFGHAVGDRALCRFADEVGLAIRAGDLLARVGGEEFVLLLVNTSDEDAVDVVNRIRRDVAAMVIEAPEPIQLTASFGVTGLEPQDVAPVDMLIRADRALYQSKLAGRDRVTMVRDTDRASYFMEPAATG